MLPADLHSFAARYTAAWCSHDPDRVASCFSPNGSIAINGGTPALGRAAIGEVARSFIHAFPDIEVLRGDTRIVGDRVEYHWKLRGTNTGPGGKGNRVRISGFESWQFGDDGLIANSIGTFDAAEYQRQIDHGADEE
jgi:uncharacterized protein (TIGR02246 family)